MSSEFIPMSAPNTNHSQERSAASSAAASRSAADGARAYECIVLDETMCMPEGTASTVESTLSPVNAFKGCLSSRMDDGSFIRADNAEMLSCIINAAVMLHLPILLIGPCAGKIISSYACSAGHKSYTSLILGSEYHAGEVHRALSADNKIIRIQNLFSPGYSDSLLTAVQETDCTVFMDYPLIEDIVTMPRSLFSFVLPVITDLFINDPLARTNSYQCQEGADIRRTSLNVERIEVGDVLSDLSLSNSALSALSSLVSTAAALYLRECSQVIDQKTASLNIFLAGALIPLAICCERRDMLAPCLDDTRVAGNIRIMLERLCSHGSWPFAHAVASRADAAAAAAAGSAATQQAAAYTAHQYSADTDSPDSSWYGAGTPPDSITSPEAMTASAASAGGTGTAQSHTSTATPSGAGDYTATNYDSASDGDDREALAEKHDGISRVRGLAGLLKNRRR